MASGLTKYYGALQSSIPIGGKVKKVKGIIPVQSLKVGKKPNLAEAYRSTRFK